MLPRKNFLKEKRMRFFKWIALCSLAVTWLAACAQPPQPASHEHHHGHDQAAATVAKDQPTAITIDELRQQMDQGKAIVFIDTRNQMAWETSASMIPGSIRISNNAQLATLIKELPKDSFIVPYCT